MGFCVDEISVHSNMSLVHDVPLFVVTTSYFFIECHGAVTVDYPGR